MLPESYYLNQMEAVKLTDGPFLSEQDLVAGKEGLTGREMFCLRLGVLVGLKQWEVVRYRLIEMIPSFSTGELWRLSAEVALVAGEVGRHHLSALLEELQPGQGWAKEEHCSLIDRARQINGISSTEHCTGMDGLTKRELALLGLGISFGARCWYT